MEKINDILGYEKTEKVEKPVKETVKPEKTEKKKLSAKERESSKLREYTAELPTPDEMNVDVYSSMKAKFDEARKENGISD